MEFRPDFGTDSVRAYFDRLHDRECEISDTQALRHWVWTILRSANRHFLRLDSAARRYHHALELHDETALAFERDLMHASLYEIVDTVYIIFEVFDLDHFDLTSSADGAGIAGEDAHFVRDVLDTMDKMCVKALHLSKIYSLPLDFKKPLNERQQLTYQTHAHWRGLVPGSAERSFFTYFSQAKALVTERLNQVPKFWHNQTVKQALMKTPRYGLHEVLQRLIMASFPEPTLADKIEKEIYTATQRHVNIITEPPALKQRQEGKFRSPAD